MSHKYAPLIAYIVFLISFLPSGVYADREFDQALFSLGLDIGAGKVGTSAGGNEENKSAFYLGFNFHYRLDPHYLVGVEFSGWTLEDTDLWDPSKGEGISQIYVVGQYYPQLDSGLFLKAGYKKVPYKKVPEGLNIDQLL